MAPSPPRRGIRNPWLAMRNHARPRRPLSLGMDVDPIQARPSFAPRPWEEQGTAG